ncbi:hypothetical protein FQY83_02475 [Luteimonas marina]|uniref:Uncharacterized protein n=1 Tax=Luteimonas marina TaxID=488485 RepID=A0A5C5UC58_9GAMM|nr:hypothetical protein FQY83_02475 [Luteimonas marina]
MSPPPARPQAEIAPMPASPRAMPRQTARRRVPRPCPRVLSDACYVPAFPSPCSAALTGRRRRPISPRRPRRRPPAGYT